jgi:branched-chain amino acid transport system ATP-binding protein
VARAGIGYVPDDRRVFAELTTWENLDVAQRVSGGRQGPWTIEAVCELFPNLNELRNRQAGCLSGGEQQMLTIARTLVGNPELLLVDEPSEGLGAAPRRARSRWKTRRARPRGAKGCARRPKLSGSEIA